MAAVASAVNASSALQPSAGAYNKVEVDDGNFDYEQRILVEVSQKDPKDFALTPLGGVVNQNGPWTFTIEPMLEKYLALSKTKLKLKCHLEREDGTVCRRFRDPVAPINLLGGCMFESVEVRLNQQPFPGASATDAGIKAYMETLLSYDADARDSHLNAQFFHMDSPFQFDNMKVHRKTLMRAFQEAVGRGEIQVTLPHPPESFQDTHVTVDDLAAADRDGKTQEELADMVLTEKMTRIAFNDGLRATNDTYLLNVFKKMTLDMYEYIGTDDRNVGFEERYNIAGDSHTFDMTVPICHDAFELDNHIGPGNRISITLSRYPDAFLLNSYMGELYHYKLVIDEMKLWIHTLERTEKIPPPMVERYMMTETQLHKQLVGMHAPAINYRLFSGGVMPKTIVLAMAPTESLNGRYNRNPFLFHHFFAKKIALKINGEEYPTGGLTFDFDSPNSEYSHGYTWMFQNSGTDESNKGNCVSWRHFEGGAFLVPFDLTPDKCNGLHNHNAEVGYIDVEINWARPTNMSITVLALLVFNKVLINDKNTSTVAFLDIEA